TSVLALKSSASITGLPEPPLTAKMTALALAAPDWKVRTRLVTGLLLLTRVMSAAYSRGLLPLIELTILLLTLTLPLATKANVEALNQSEETNELVSVLPSA